MDREQVADELTTEELKRIDALLSAARRLHYTSFALAALSLALSSLDKPTDISLPVGEVTLPSTQAAVSIYVLVLALTMAADRLFLMAYPWLRLDTRRPPFAWVALSLRPVSRRSVLLWLVLPVVICAIGTANTLEFEDQTGFYLSFIGLLVICLPKPIGHYWALIQSRSDHRGGPATFSIFLLYWHRVLRSIVYIAWLFVPVLAVVPKWRTAMLRAGSIMIAVLVVEVVIRTIGGFGFVYRRIDRFGSRFGFPAESRHYD